MRSIPLYLLVLIIVEAFCAVIFTSDVVFDVLHADKFDWHIVVEALASISLLVAIFFQVQFLIEVLRRKQSLERTAQMANRAVHDIIEKNFDSWALTASERDIAGLLVKGLSIAEIAKVRNSAEGTIKSHLNAIYRKSGTRSRADVMSQIMDSMIDRPLVDGAAVAIANTSDPETSDR